MKIGFIGLGIMGKPMARNLMGAGHEVVGYNRRREKADELAGEGSTIAARRKDVAAACETVINMLPNAREVREVVAVADGVF